MLITSYVIMIILPVNTEHDILEPEHVLSARNTSLPPPP